MLRLISTVCHGTRIGVDGMHDRSSRVCSKVKEWAGLGS